MSELTALSASKAPLFALSPLEHTVLQRIMLVSEFSTEGLHQEEAPYAVVYALGTTFNYYPQGKLEDHDLKIAEATACLEWLIQRGAIEKVGEHYRLTNAGYWSCYWLDQREKGQINSMDAVMLAIQLSANDRLRLSPTDLALDTHMKWDDRFVIEQDDKPVLEFYANADPF